MIPPCGAPWPESKKIGSVCPACGNALMQEDTTRCPTCGHALQKALSATSPHCPSNPLPKTNAHNAPAGTCTINDAKALFAGLSASPCPLDFFIHSCKTLLFNIDEHTQDLYLQSYFFNIQSVEEDFNTDVKRMYHVHNHIYNLCLNDVLGEDEAKKYALLPERAEKEFQAFSGTLEAYKHDILDACEQIKQGIIHRDKTIEKKNSRKDNNLGYIVLSGIAATFIINITFNFVWLLLPLSFLLIKSIQYLLYINKYKQEIEHIKNTIAELKQKIKACTHTVQEIIKKEQLNLIYGSLLTELCDALNTEVNSGALSAEEMKKALSLALQHSEIYYKTITAHMYRDGISVPQDLKKAYHLYVASAKQQCGEAFAALGLMHKNQEKAFACFQKAAELGSASGIQGLGTCYSKGYGTQKNTAMAFELFLKAAAMGNKSAQLSAALCYFTGIGAEQSYAHAYEFFELAAEKGDREAQYFIGYMYENGLAVSLNKQEAFARYQRAAAYGSIHAITKVGYMYEQGSGVKKDTLMAVRYYKEAAEKGNARAQAYLGQIYFTSYGCLQNIKRGRELLRQSAEAGDDLGQLLYGCSMVISAGNYSLAVKWYALSAKQGNAAAMAELAECYDKGQGVKKDKIKAMQLYKMALEHGYAKEE